MRKTDKIIEKSISGRAFQLRLCMFLPFEKWGPFPHQENPRNRGSYSATAAHTHSSSKECVCTVRRIGEKYGRRRGRRRERREEKGEEKRFINLKQGRERDVT